ncbi:uncharacterized protein LOC123682567 [Harmonia axyridis]|uniref:uncharacterized protein LOC123682567 n=1 Tax=Harmonia axyridis TaxID=115357 RepID=UPI001E2767FD|nr:uncharacterized protein LOC123682567 [Harmonia axyridis]XP_045477230.1 uncharacterized protein LOC123682567 [Harmonia axyridis]
MEELPKVNSVRAIIDLFEENCRSETAIRLNKSMSKSFSGLSFSERKLKSNTTNDSNLFYNLEQRLLAISFKLKDYRVYAKDRHIGIQEELVEIMTILLNTDIKNSCKKRELVYDIRACFKELNDKLPGSFGLLRQGFGDSTYQPFNWRRPNSIGGAILNSKEPIKTTDSQIVYGSSSAKIPTSPRGGIPLRTQSFVERYYPSEFDGADKQAKSFESNDALLSPSSFRRSPDFVIGGAVGTRRPVNTIGLASVIARSNDQVHLRAFQRSASEVASGEIQETPTTIGSSENSKRLSYGGQLRERRRPVSLGGAAMTFNTHEDIISSLKFPHQKPLTPTKDSEQHEDHNEKEFQNNEVEIKDSSEDDNLQSVDLLKKFFELKSVEKIQQQKSFNAKENQREDFQEYVQSIEKSVQANEESVDDSNNDTIVTIDITEDGEKRIVISRSNSSQVDDSEALNTPMLRQEEVDEVVITSKRHDSCSSQQSIYLDPVD